MPVCCAGGLAYKHGNPPQRLRPVLLEGSREWCTHACSCGPPRYYCTGGSCWNQRSASAARKKGRPTDRADAILPRYVRTHICLFIKIMVKRQFAGCWRGSFTICEYTQALLLASTF